MISYLKYLPFSSAARVTRKEAAWKGYNQQRRFAERAKGGVPRALKGPGDPTVMRRFIDIMDADDDVDDDFLVEDTTSSGRNAKQPSPRNPAQPDPENPKHVKIRTSQYVSSSTKLETCPKDGRAEFAVIGRSNVGKSSLINLLTKNKNLALTSKQPGYGYAKSSQELRVDWNKFTKQFFLQRQTLLCVLLLIDASIPPQQVDIECAAWLTSAEVPFMVVFTKADKTKRRGTRVEDNVSAFLEALQADVGVLPDSFLTSSSAGTGANDLLRHLAGLRESWLAAVGKPAKVSPLIAAVDA